jgi:hypothetical protein
MNPIDTIISAGLGAIVVTIVAGFVTSLRNQKEVLRQVRHLSSMDVFRASDWEAMAKVQRPMLSGIKASLEAHRDGKCNGNVVAAHTDITEGIKEYDAYLATLYRRGK